MNICIFLTKGKFSKTGKCLFFTYLFLDDHHSILTLFYVMTIFLSFFRIMLFLQFHIKKITFNYPESVFVSVFQSRRCFSVLKNSFIVPFAITPLHVSLGFFFF